MEFHSYNQELAIASAQFKRFFNNISIVRNGKEYKFKCLIGNRSRILKNWENPLKNSKYTLPMVIIQRTGITKNNERLTNINNEVKYSIGSNKLNYNLYTPVPIDINFDVTFISKYPSDIDRALSNIIPFFNKDVFVRCKHPKFNELFLKSQVIMDDSISEDHPDAFDETEDDITTVTCSFLYKTWIFCGNDVVSSEDNYVKHTISCGLSCDGLGHCIELSNVIETEYNGFIPAIRQINFGIYPIPVLSGHIEHMKWVDKLSTNGQDESPFVDRLKWKIDESGIMTGQVDNSYHYADYISEYLSSYYDSVITPDGIVSGQLSSYSYLSGPDEAHQPHQPKISALN